MSKRITVMLDNDLADTLHKKQAKEIQKTMKSVSFSKILNQTLREVLK